VSVFQLHNETVNIWRAPPGVAHALRLPSAVVASDAPRERRCARRSHLAGFIFFLGLSVWFACNHGCAAARSTSRLRARYASVLQTARLR